MTAHKFPSALLRTAFPLFVVLLMSVSMTAATPVVICEKAAHDFGYATQGAMISHTFDIVNKGVEPLVITRVEPNLKLLTATLDKFTLYPNDHASLKLEYDSRYGMGKVEPTVVLTTTDPAHTSITFKLMGHVFQQTAANGNMRTNMEATPRMMEPPARIVSYVWTMVSVFLGIR